MWSAFKCVTFLQSESSKRLLRTEQMGHGHSWSSPFSAGMQSWLQNPCLNRAINSTPARPARWVAVFCTILSFIHGMTRAGSSYFSPSELQDSCRVQREPLDNWIGILWSELLTYGKGLNSIRTQEEMTWVQTRSGSLPKSYFNQYFGKNITIHKVPPWCSFVTLNIRRCGVQLDSGTHLCNTNGLFVSLRF